jgi:hypothetical protein
LPPAAHADTFRSRSLLSFRLAACWPQFAHENEKKVKGAPETKNKRKVGENYVEHCCCSRVHYMYVASSLALRLQPVAVSDCIAETSPPCRSLASKQPAERRDFRALAEG